MRIDKYLKVCRIIKRRELAKEMLDKGMVKINGKIAKPANEVDIGDSIEVTSPSGKVISFQIKDIKPYSTVDNAVDMYEIINK